MATVIQFKRSSTQNDVYSTSDLALGELLSILITVDFLPRRMTVQHQL